MACLPKTPPHVEVAVVPRTPQSELENPGQPRLRWGTNVGKQRLSNTIFGSGPEQGHNLKEMPIVQRE